MTYCDNQLRMVLFIVVNIVFNSLYAQVKVVDRPGKNVFVLSAAKKTTGILVDKNDDEAVKRAASMFASDVHLVTGNVLKVGNNPAPSTTYMVIAGTIEKNNIIRKLIENKKLDIAPIKNTWERFTIQLIKNPLPGVKQAVVVAGSDRRAVAYGLFSISEIIGVSPWYWWADVPVKKRDNIYLKIDDYVSPAPSVKYRGIFINDEDWGLLPWAKYTFDPQLKDIGPKTYAKVFELLLRLKANYLCPAMHEASGAFNKYPENKRVADSFGIVMGSVHPEPLLFNNASEWDRKTMGEWNYLTNKENIIKVLNKRVRENGMYENVYTVGLRGLHDRAMEGNYPMSTRIKLLEDAINDQRNILKKNINKPIEEIPQAFTPYKEVLDIYSAGMKLPDDVTIVWPDDNYGYLKRLSSPNEQKRSGRSGVYYHASYLGSPHDYLWLSSTPPALMYEELNKAYATGADRLWLLNVGDIKSCETPMTLFLNMAYEIKKFNFENVVNYQAQWLSDIYGQNYYNDFEEITKEYYRLAFFRKPEFMGWGYEWNTNEHPRERTTATEFSFANYSEAQNRIQAYRKIGARVEHILKELPDKEQPSFFQLLYYPVKGAELMNLKWLTAQQHSLYLSQGRAKANVVRDNVKHYYDTLYKISYDYNDLLNGKWKRIMSLKQGVTASYYEMPNLDSVQVPEKGSIKLFVEGEDVQTGLKGFHSLPAFNKYLPRNYFIEVYNTGRQNINWSLKASDDWIITTKMQGNMEYEDKILVSVDWSKVPVGTSVLGHINFISDQKKEQVLISAFNPASPDINELKGIFVEDNGCVSIPAASFHRKNESKDIKMQLIPNLGFEDTCVMLGDPTAAVQNPKSTTAPSLEYDFYCFNAGWVDVYTYVLPTFPVSADKDFSFHESSGQQTTYGVCIDEGALAIPTSAAPEYSQTWSENVLRNAAINKSTLYIDKPGKHTVKIKCGNPGVVIQKIVLDFGGLKKSYMGPNSTMVK